MQLKPVPAPTLTAICTLLRPYAPEVSETRLVDALAVYEGDRTPEIRPLLSKRETARLLGVSPWTAVRMGQRGQLPLVRVGGQLRFPAEAVRKLAAGEVRAEGAGDAA